MPMRQRITAAAALLVLGSLAMLFLGGEVTRCLGPLGRTFVESVRDGCIAPSVGPGMPIGAAAVVAATLSLLEGPGVRPRASLIGAAGGASVALVAYWLLRPIAVTGATSTGDIITVNLPFDRWASLAAGIAGAGFGWLLGLWRSRPREPRLRLSLSK